ncbi:MAG: glycosyltransferase [Candidatus Portnoybacteria bacterium]|nr:glycosyltransferase [Candidatus Portnoybacteria bacterium]
MKIGVDIRILGKNKMTGIENYASSLFSSLLNKDKKNEYIFFYNGFKKPNLDFDFLKESNAKLIIKRFPNQIFDLFLKIFKYPKIDLLLDGVDVFLSPHFLITPLSNSCKRILVFCDLSFVRYPEFFSFSRKLWHWFVCPKKQAVNASKIVTISESSKRDLIDLYNIKKDKIEIIYPGINGTDKSVENLVKKYSFLNDKKAIFLLCLATIEPRKNILGVIEAFEKIKESKSNVMTQVRWSGFEGEVKRNGNKILDFSNLKLIIAGSEGWLYREVLRKIKKSNYKEDIFFIGFVDQKDKFSFYNIADLFIYPSFFEGFGLPPLEAMACGLPVVISNNSSLPEVVSDAGIMVDPHKAGEIASAVEITLSNEKLYRRLSGKGLKRSQEFNWDNAGKQILKIINYEGKN